MECVPRRRTTTRTRTTRTTTTTTTTTTFKLIDRDARGEKYEQTHVQYLYSTRRRNREQYESVWDNIDLSLENKSPRQCKD